MILRAFFPNLVRATGLFFKYSIFVNNSYGFFFENRNPFSPSTTYSFTKPTGVVITGTPEAIASIVVREVVSDRLGRTYTSIVW